MKQLLIILLFASSLLAQSWSETQPIGDVGVDWAICSISGTNMIAGIAYGRLYVYIGATTNIKKSWFCS